MSGIAAHSPPVRRGRRRRDRVEEKPAAHCFRAVTNPLPTLTPLSSDHVDALHEAALTVLETLGIRVLLTEAVELFRDAGCLVENDCVRLGREVVGEALRLAPDRFTLRARNPAHCLPIGGSSLLFGIGAGCPNISDRLRGRRPGTFADFVETTRLQQATPLVSKLAPSIEPQDVPLAIRHLRVTATQMELSDKVPFAYARGRAQVEDIFHILKLAHGLDPDEELRQPLTYTVINTNSPRQLDAPMSQGLIDFAKAGQVSVVTPFCLAGAMAPTSLDGALILSHAEALAGITLAQLAKAGAPVVYGTFSSNVDMRSGAPLFGTPEHMKANIVGGQLARHVGLPWRAGSGTAANSADAQAAYETLLATQSAMQAGANFIYHALGWLEGGLTFSFEKFALDVEAVEIALAAHGAPSMADIPAALEAIGEVEPGGHFFGSAHTMKNYRTAFFEHNVFSSANFGQWEDAGRPSAEEQATARWQALLDTYQQPPLQEDRSQAIAEFVDRRERDGGAPPLS